MIGWRGRCEVHEKYTVEDIENARAQFPDVKILTHPECSPEVVAASDFSGSTSRMISYVKQCPSKQILLLTECSMGDNIAAENRDKEMIRLCSVRCPHMNEITLEDTLNALRHDQYPIEVEETVRVKARHAIDRMLAMS
jgi:quinolinate synthase